jgi:deoxyadenosine/deoxycytidine kinase
MKRIRSRSRNAEENIQEHYIQYLHNCYQTHLHEIARHFKIPVIRIDWNEFRSTEYIAQCVHTTLGIKSEDVQNHVEEQRRLRVIS